MTARRLASLAASLFFSLPAFAGEKTPLSALPTRESPHTLSESTKVDGFKTTTIGLHTEIVAKTTEGYCFGDGSSDLLSLSSQLWNPENAHEIWRFVETHDSATLERTTIAVGAGLEVMAKTRSNSKLMRVAHRDGVTIWGLREGNGDVLLFSRGKYFGGREAPGVRKDSDGMIPFISSDCAFGATRLSGRDVVRGSVAELTGSHNLSPSTTQTASFRVHASLAKVGRDPEPMLSIHLEVSHPPT